MRGGKAQRDTLYAQAMARVANDYPDDEATLFHALAVLGLNQGVRDVSAYMRASSLRFSALNGRHPVSPAGRTSHAPAE